MALWVQWFSVFVAVPSVSSKRGRAEWCVRKPREDATKQCFEIRTWWSSTCCCWQSVSDFGLIKKNFYKTIFTCFVGVALQMEAASNFWELVLSSHCVEAMVSHLSVMCAAVLLSLGQLVWKLLEDSPVSTSHLPWSSGVTALQHPTRLFTWVPGTELWWLDHASCACTHWAVYLPSLKTNFK